MSRYLVTGCAGFIGSHLCERLIRTGNKVVGIDSFDLFYHRSIKEDNLNEIIDNPDFELIEGDICEQKTWSLLANQSFDMVFHLAAKAGVRPSINEPEKYIESNIIGTQKLIEWMIKYNNKNLIFASSSSVYGNNEKIPFSESDNVDFPISPYAYTKKACESMIYTNSYLFDIKAICLRFFTVYGPRQRPDLAIHKFFKSIYNGDKIIMFGEGRTSRDYTYIDDIIDGVISANDNFSFINEKFEIINLGSDNPIELVELIKSIERISNRKAIIDSLPMQPGDVFRTYADINKAKLLLNYNPKYSLYSGLDSFNNWYINKKHEE